MIPANEGGLKPLSNADLARRDLEVLWHPCSQMKDHETRPPIPIKKGQGVWLEDFDGNRYLDAISSWWVNLFGHANPRISAAISEQLVDLDQVMLAGFTHGPVLDLAERLVGIAPAGLARCFFADNGACAVEIALKMSFHYWQNIGRLEKRRFMNVTNSYHGETLGALAVCDVPLYKRSYGPLLMDVITAPSPDCYYRERGESWADYSRRRFALMEELLEQYAAEVCAVIIEPLVQGAGYMRMYDPVYLKLLRQACDRHEVHFIADEIAVGFGRTGTLFASEQAQVTPDFMCLSKGLTGGFLPLSVVMTTDAVYQAFYDEYTRLTGFLHSHSYTGNPLACRAALATLEIFEQEPVLENNAVLASTMRELTAHFEDHPHIAEVRQHGMILAMEMVQDKTARTPFPWQERRGQRVYHHALDRGVLLRPMGDVVYFMPPYVITPEEIRFLADIAWESIEIATRD